MMKRFLEWIQIKEKLHNNNPNPPLVTEGEVWWASIGDNIGQEMNGKGRDFTRPIYIYKKLSYISHIGIPTSTVIKTGNWYVSVKQETTNILICLNQIRNVDYKRLKSKICTLCDNDQLKIIQGFVYLCVRNIKDPIFNRIFYNILHFRGVPGNPRTDIGILNYTTLSMNWYSKFKKW